MTYIDKRLLKMSKSSGNKLVLEVGESAVGLYIGYELKFNEKYGKEQACYKIKLADGSIKELRSSSGKVAGKFYRIPPQTKIKVTKLGEGQNTDYDVKMSSVVKTAAPVEEDDLDTAVEEPEVQEDEVVEEEAEISEAEF